MANQHWSDLDGDSKFKIILGLVSGNLTLIYTYITLAAKQIARGKFTPPDLEDGVTVTTKTETTVNNEPK